MFVCDREERERERGRGGEREREREREEEKECVVYNVAHIHTKLMNS